MYSKNTVLVAIGVLGLLIGVVASSVPGEDTSAYCQSIEQELKQNQSFQGSVACYPPGAIDVNLSERVEENSELECVCRTIDQSGTGIFPIVRSN